MRNDRDRAEYFTSVIVSLPFTASLPNAEDSRQQRRRSPSRGREQAAASIDHLR